MSTTAATGQHARSPFAMPAKGWKQVLVRSWKEGGDDNIGLIAAGVAFYGFLALVPLLGAIVLSYGLVASPETVMRNMKGLTSVMPAQAAGLIGDQLMNVVTTSGGKKGLGLLLALGLALFGARNGAGSVMTALNIAYEEKETRGLVATNLTALAITAGAVMVAIVAVVAIAALAQLDRLLPGAPAALLVVGKLLTYLLLLGAAAGVAAALYRYGPSRARARWVWLTPGSLLAAIGGVVLTLGFGFYVARFGNYNATYGSLGAVVVLLTWLYLSSYLLLFGAELNSELEHQTDADTTAGADRPLGAREAWVADHVAGDAEPGDAPSAKPMLPASDQPSAAAAYLSARVTSRVGRVVGLRKVGMISAGVATLGLSLLRRRGRGAAGVVVLSGAALLAWLGREEEEG